MAKQIDYYVEQNIDGEWRLLDYLRHNYHERPRQTITENPVFGAKLTIIDYYKGNSASGAVVDAVFENIGDHVATGDAVQVTGFGKFDIRDVATRKGRNPQTGEELHIEAKNYPRFKAGKNLREKVL